MLSQGALRRMHRANCVLPQDLTQKVYTQPQTHRLHATISSSGRGPHYAQGVIYGAGPKAGGTSWTPAAMQRSVSLQQRASGLTDELNAAKRAVRQQHHTPIWSRLPPRALLHLLCSMRTEAW